MAGREPRSLPPPDEIWLPLEHGIPLWQRRHTITGRIARYLHLDCSGVACGLWERRSGGAWRYDLLLPERLPDHDTSHG